MQAMADLKKDTAERETELKKVQATLEQALHDSKKWKNNYVLEKHNNHRWNCIRDQIGKLFCTRYGLPEAEFAKLTHELSADYERRFTLREKKKKQKAAKEAEEQGQQVGA